LWLSERETKLPESSGLTVADLHTVLNEIRHTSAEVRAVAKSM